MILQQGSQSRFKTESESKQSLESSKIKKTQMNKMKATSSKCNFKSELKKYKPTKVTRTTNIKNQKIKRTTTESKNLDSKFEVRLDSKIKEQQVKNDQIG